MTNQNTNTSNQELLSWAVENIKEWDDDCTHLRSDKSTNPVFYTTGYWHVLPENIWDNPSEDGGRGQWYNLEGKKFSTDTPQVITREEWLNGVASKDAPTSSSEAQEGHVHAELMAEYALVAKTNPEPWKEFESKHKRGEDWVTMYDYSYWDVDCDYRRKPTPPKTMNIGGVIVEAWPLDKLPTTKVYWSVIVLDGIFRATACDINYVPGPHRNRLDTGKAFSTEEQAQAVADALNLVYNRALGKVE
jgi:hypothetical protein